MAFFNFDATTVEPQQSSFSPLPAGVYIAQVVDSDVVTNRAGTGEVMKLQFEILDGEFVNRKLFANLNVRHQNATAQQIAQAQLSSLCGACGVGQITDTTQLHHIPMKIKVAIRKDNEDQNEIKDYQALDNKPKAPSAPSAPSAPAKAPAKAPTQSADVPPWQR